MKYIFFFFLEVAALDDSYGRPADRGQHAGPWARFRPPGGQVSTVPGTRDWCANVAEAEQSRLRLRFSFFCGFGNCHV